MSTIFQPREYECFYDLTGLLFDAVTRSCVWAAKAKCFTEEDSLFQAVEAEYEPDFECKRNGRVPDPDYCMRYFECDKRLGVRAISCFEYYNTILCFGNMCIFFSLDSSIVPPGHSMTSEKRNVCGRVACPAGRDGR